MTDVPWTPGPWPIEASSDGKRIIVGKGLIEGPNGYDLAEVYSDDCDYAEASANAHLIAEAPAMAEALEQMLRSLEAKLRQYEEWDGGAHPTSPIGNARAILARIKGATP